MKMSRKSQKLTLVGEDGAAALRIGVLTKRTRDAIRENGDGKTLPDLTRNRFL